ncbi:MAG: DegT/DnrJ/EryC1/StrS family aminotransferase [Anaerolineae bacterium]
MSRGVSTMIYYPLPLHLQGLYRGPGHGRGGAARTPKPPAVRCSRCPCIPELTVAQQEEIVAAVAEFYR